MRVLRIAPARQLALFAGRAASDAGYWDGLPEQARAEVLALLSRIIARGVLACDSPVLVSGGGCSDDD
jgi:hypothetical protein